VEDTDAPPRSLWPAAEPALGQLLRDTLGSKAEIESVTVANQALDYVVLHVGMRYPPLPVVVKLAGPASPYPARFERTAWVHDLVTSRSPVPVPRVLAAGASLGRLPLRYIVTTYIPGVPWSALRLRLDAERQAAIQEQIAAAVAALHGITFPAFGDLPPAEAAMPIHYIDALQARARTRIKGKANAQLFADVLAERQSLFSGVTIPCLCHDDLHQHNILFTPEGNGWRLAAILDFDSAWAGHHESDLARLDLWRGMTSSQFWAMYGAAHTLDAGYAERRPIHQLLWCLEYAELTPEHLADTARVCSELGIPPVASFE
jgi:aminoglycoside phosphotransferase (APT) family kinase protein